MTTADKIVISHASADRKLADLLRDTLVLGGIPRERIFYSSSRATGIPSGTDVRAHLRSELQQAGLNVAAGRLGSFDHPVKVPVERAPTSRPG